jgi:hypothetical protein
MSPGEQAQRDLIARQLDALLAIVAVELRKESVRSVGQRAHVIRARAPIAAHWLEQKAS